MSAEQAVVARVVARARGTRHLDAATAVRAAERGALDVVDPALGRRLAATGAGSRRGRPRPAPRGWPAPAVLLVVGGVCGPIAMLGSNRRYSSGWLLDLPTGALSAGVVTLAVAVAWGPFTRWVRGTAVEDLLPVPPLFTLFWAGWAALGAVVTVGRLLTDDREGLAVLGLVLQLVAIALHLRTWWSSRGPAPEPEPPARDRGLLRSVPRSDRDAVVAGGLAGITELHRRGRLSEDQAHRAGQQLRERWGTRG